MSAESIMTLVIITSVALIMVILGVVQYTKKEEPVGFYNTGDPPRKDEITDITAWNKKHGMIWIMYGIIIELSYWAGFLAPTEVLEATFMIGGIIIPIPFLILRHHSLVREYGRVKK